MPHSLSSHHHENVYIHLFLPNKNITEQNGFTTSTQMQGQDNGTLSAQLRASRGP